jgi:methyltransferase
MKRSVLLLVVVFVPMLIEARRSRRNAAALRARGAVEPPGDVYVLMQVAYPACFVAMAAEGWTGPAGGARWIGTGAAVYVASKALKYWAISTLGGRWTFRVLVPPDAPRITTGPYRWLRHPNYVGVAGELAGMALMAHAPITGVLSFVCFGALLLARISVEDRALRLDVRDR